jgi:type IV fimbrial biogenesis protein FimT
MELMVTLAVASVLIGLAIPGIRDFIRNNRLSGGVNDLLHSLQLARTEAIKRQNPVAGQQTSVVVCGTNNPTAADNAITCSYNTFSGWFVFQDTNGDWQHALDGSEPVIERHALLDGSVTVKTGPAGNQFIMSYAPSGFSTLPGAVLPTSTVVLCDARGVHQIGTGATARALLLSSTGRARASQAWNDVSVLALPVVGGACP